MGKWNRHNELQEYLDDIKERQDHQYSKGYYWFNKVLRKSYASPEGEKRRLLVFFFQGGALVLVAGLFLIPDLLKG